MNVSYIPRSRLGPFDRAVNFNPYFYREDPQPAGNFVKKIIYWSKCLFLCSLKIVAKNIPAYHLHLDYLQNNGNNQPITVLENRNIFQIFLSQVYISIACPKIFIYVSRKSDIDRDTVLTFEKMFRRPAILITDQHIDLDDDESLFLEASIW